MTKKEVAQKAAVMACLASAYDIIQSTSHYEDGLEDVAVEIRKKYREVQNQIAEVIDEE